MASPVPDPSGSIRVPLGAGPLFARPGPGPSRREGGRQRSKTGAKTDVISQGQRRKRGATEKDRG